MRRERGFAENRRLFGRAIGAWIMPTAVWSDERVSLFRPPGAAFVTENRVMVLEDPIDHLPCGFNRVFASEERPVALHGVAQKPFVRRFLSRLFIGQIKLSLLSDEFLAG